MKSKALDWLALHVAPPLAKGYLLFCYYTTRFRRLGREHAAQFRDRGETVIYAFWHQRLMLEPLFHREESAIIMIGRHRDAEYFARVLRLFGHELARGSSTRGGLAALKGVIRGMRDGKPAAMVPDGPKGPAREAKMGVIQLARMTGRPIIPSAGAVRRARFVGSWDRMLIPLPFTRGVYLQAEPLFVPRDADEEHLEDLRQQLEKALNEVTERADREARGETP